MDSLDLLAMPCDFVWVIVLVFCQSMEIFQIGGTKAGMCKGQLPARWARWVGGVQEGCLGENDCLYCRRNLYLALVVLLYVPKVQCQFRSRSAFLSLVRTPLFCSRAPGGKTKRTKGAVDHLLRERNFLGDHLQSTDYGRDRTVARQRLRAFILCGVPRPSSAWAGIFCG